MIDPVWPTGFLHIMTALAYGGIAAIVTVHVLRTKTDVRAALGWIAIAWLSPVIGGVLYYLFGINRVTRRALKFETASRRGAQLPSVSARPDVAPNIATLAQIGQRVSGNRLSGGNAVSILKGGDEAYPPMLAALRAARDTVALASYIFRSDAVGAAFVDALIAASRRGVAVRVLLDGVGSGYVRSTAVRELQSAGVPVARFLHTWMPWRMPFLNMRNHKKLLIVDGATAFTGGLNIGADNLSTAPAERRVEDVHFRVEGPIVAQMTEAFAHDWSFTANEVLDAALWRPGASSQGAVFCRGILSGPDADIDKAETVLGAALTQARTRIRIATPYFLPDQRLLFAMSEAGLRGVAIDLVVPCRTDYVFMDWAMRAHLRFFQDLPASLYLSPPPFDHSKLMTVDGEWCLIGSSNWDARSLRLNFEFDLECYDPALAAAIDALIDGKIARSHGLARGELLGAPKWVQLRDAAVRLLLPYL